MYKIAILGCENSHANSFLNYIVKDKIYTDIEVLGVYSEYEGAAEKLNEDYGVPIAKSYDEFVGKIDGLIITARHGKDHYRFAKPYIESGIPMFIDKPVAANAAEALEFMKELKANNVRISGGSSCIHDEWVQELKIAVAEKAHGDILGGFLRAPVNMNNDYGNFLFYSQHLAQITQEIFGYYPKSVKVDTNGKVTNVLVRYDEFSVTMNYVDGNYKYYAALSAKDGVFGAPLAMAKTVFQTEFKNFYDILIGEPQKQSYREFMAPMALIDAISRAMESGKEEALVEIEEI